MKNKNHHWLFCCLFLVDVCLFAVGQERIWRGIWMRFWLAPSCSEHQGVFVETHIFKTLVVLVEVTMMGWSTNFWKEKTTIYACTFTAQIQIIRLMDDVIHSVACVVQIQKIFVNRSWLRSAAFKFSVSRGSNMEQALCCVWRDMDRTACLFSHSLLLSVLMFISRFLLCRSQRLKTITLPSGSALPQMRMVWVRSNTAFFGPGIYNSFFESYKLHYDTKTNCIIIRKQIFDLHGIFMACFKLSVGVLPWM